MYVGGGGVESCNKKLSVCVSRTVSGRGSVGGCIEVCVLYASFDLNLAT